MQKPAAPGITAFQQVNNQTGVLEWNAPTNDADGSPLTGLTYYKAIVFILPAGAVELPATFDDAAALPGAQPLVLAADQPLTLTWQVQGFGIEHHVYLAANDVPMPA
ncbi:MAG: hypothetical protein ACKV2Q_36615 [Planctomycetaceae bacterium]